MRSFWLLVGTLVGTSIGLITSEPVSAQWRAGAQWQDSSGDLVVTVMDRWARSCASGTAQSSYSVAGGVEGLLYPDDCNNDSGQYRFGDTAGAERCIGTAVWETVSQTVRDTTWIIEAPVSGFPCSTVGQVYNVRLYSSEAPATARPSGSSAGTQGIEWIEVDNPLAFAAVGRNTIVRRGNHITFDAIADGQYVRYDGNCQTRMLYRLKIGLLDADGQLRDVTTYGNDRWFPVSDYQRPILSTACSI
ncbi:MAG: hypothetical protein WA949_23665 [Phormidesmis sp.]